MWLDTIVESVLKGIANLSRKSPPKREAVGWSRPHSFNVDDSCVYCGATRSQARLGMKCRGPK